MTNKKTHILLAQNNWLFFIKKNTLIIDTTCGNGHDSLFIAQNLNKIKGKLICIDIQQNAIENTKDLLKSENPNFLDFTSFHLRNHEDLEKVVTEKPDLIIYNLGYLPGSDKELKTIPKTTLISISKAFSLIKKNGLISITCYPGHLEGNIEEKEILKMIRKLPPKEWKILYFKHKDKENAPSLLLIEKL